MTFELAQRVRDLLEADRLERAEESARALGVILRERPPTRWLWSMREERLAIEQMFAAAGADQGHLAAVVECVERLTLNWHNDLRLEESASPWLWVVRTLLRIDPKLSANAARRWYATVITVSLDIDDSIPNRPFIANVAGVLSAHALEDAKAEHHLMSGQVEAEGAEEDETGPFLQAVRWVRRAIRRGSDLTPAGD